MIFQKERELNGDDQGVGRKSGERASYGGREVKDPQLKREERHPPGVATGPPSGAEEAVHDQPNGTKMKVRSARMVASI